MAEQRRLFLSYSFSVKTKNIVDAFCEVAQQNGFTVITGAPPGRNSPPELVRQRIFSSDCFAAIMTVSDSDSKTSAWISNEIGIAYALDLPLMICPEDTVDDLGLTNMATSYQAFNRNDLARFKKGLDVYFRDIKTDPRLTHRVSLGSVVNNLARIALQGYSPDVDTNNVVLSRLTSAVDSLVEQSQRYAFSFGESDEFAEKRKKHLTEKQAIARHVTDHYLTPYEDRDNCWIFMDSGTVTYTICEELVSRPLRVPVMTNNLASCRTLSAIPGYPLFVVPGEMETRYVASLGDTCVDFLKQAFPSHQPPARPIELAIIAATSISSNAGICGNDPRHNILKRTLLEKAPKSILCFEGEKLLYKDGVEIFQSSENWRTFSAGVKKESVCIVTHYPEKFGQLAKNQKKLFESEISKLRINFGESNVIVLGSSEADDNQDDESNWEQNSEQS